MIFLNYLNSVFFLVFCTSCFFGYRKVFQILSFYTKNGFSNFTLSHSFFITFFSFIISVLFDFFRQPMQTYIWQAYDLWMIIICPLSSDWEKYISNKQIQVLYICVSFWLLSHKSRDIYQTETKITWFIANN